jgi:hypothetical protein
MAGRARLPKVMRRKLQYYVRIFVFMALSWITLWYLYIAAHGLSQMGDVMKMYGFVPGII